eukprot:6783746-Prymnesium_polylepis.1
MELAYELQSELTPCWNVRAKPPCQTSVYISRERADAGEEKPYFLAPINAKPNKIELAAKLLHWLSLDEVNDQRQQPPPEKTSFGTVSYKGHVCSVLRDPIADNYMLRWRSTSGRDEQMLRCISRDERFTEAEIAAMPKAVP